MVPAQRGSFFIGVLLAKDILNQEQGKGRDLRNGKFVSLLPSTKQGETRMTTDAYATTKAWQCQGCQAIVWRQTAGKTLTERQAQRLLGGASVELAGLKSRAGKTFSATARIEDGKVKLVFGGAG